MNPLALDFNCPIRIVPHLPCHRLGLSWPTVSLRHMQHCGGAGLAEDFSSFPSLYRAAPGHLETPALSVCKCTKGP